MDNLTTATTVISGGGAGGSKGKILEVLIFHCGYSETENQQCSDTFSCYKGHKISNYNLAEMS